MPGQLEQKILDPEAELSNVQRIFQKLAPSCSVARRGGGEPLLAPQEKQLGILASELKETLLCINLAKKGMHGLRDQRVKLGTQQSITQYETLDSVLRDEKSQQNELDLLNYLAQKQIIELIKRIQKIGKDEVVAIENANNRLRRMENRLDIAMKRFCLVNSDNAKIREEIQRLLVERNDFNIQWNRTIVKLVKGKEYLMDIFEIATGAFGDRDECCRKLEALKWKGLFHLNRDISEMQSYEGDLNHLAKLEEFLRIKGTRRICEADEIEEIKRQEEIAKCEQEIAWHDSLLEEIFRYAGSDKISNIASTFDKAEKENFSCFQLLCEVLQESIILRRELEDIRQTILDKRDMNEGREERENQKLAALREDLKGSRERTQVASNSMMAADLTISKVLKGIDELVRVAKCDFTPLLSLLGNHKEVTQWNVSKFLKILEMEVKSLIEVAYGMVKTPAQAPMPTRLPLGKKGSQEKPAKKLVAEPQLIQLKANKIEKLVPYLPCAYCVEDYIMNLVFETPAVPADDEYVQAMLHLDDVNTKFGIFTLTVPAKRHPYRTTGDKKE